MTSTNDRLQQCLYFTSNTLARSISKMAEEAFKSTGLSPAHAFLLLLVAEQPGITQKALAVHLQLAPSTVTRFVDTLKYRGFLERCIEGKTTLVFATRQGTDLQDSIRLAWKKLNEHYCDLLGQERAEDLARQLNLARRKLD